MNKSNINNTVTDKKDDLPKYLSGRRFCDICNEELDECKGHDELFNRPLTRADLRSFHKSGNRSIGLAEVKEILNHK